MEHELRALREKYFFWQKDRALYRALDSGKREFRLVVVRAGRREDPLQVDLRRECLNVGRGRSIPTYETISYCWGDPTDVATIQINKKGVAVPASSAAALRCMRETHTDRVLWLDAVCINQADLDERAQQVGMMAEIYSNSQGNLVYLGEENKFTLRAIESIYRCLEDIKNATRNLEVVEHTPLDYRSVNTFFSQGSRKKNTIDVEAIDSFFSNPWFRRVWPLQEVALASSNTCHCGPWVLGFLDMVRVARWIKYSDKGGDSTLINHSGLTCANEMWKFVDDSFGSAWSVGSPGDPGSKLYHLLCSSRDRQASEPRDYVYGVLGLRNTIRRRNGLPAVQQLEMDYRTPIEAVFRDATRAALLEHTGFGTLVFISHRSEESMESESRPSWVLRLSDRHDVEQDPDQFYHQFNASAGLNCMLQSPASSDKWILATFGLVLDQVVGVGNVMDRAAFYDRNAKRTWLRSVVAQVQQHTRGIISHNEIATTVIAGLNPERGRDVNSALRGYFEFLEFDPVTGLCVSGWNDSSEANDRQHNVDQFCNGMTNCVNRRVLFNRSGSIGLGPKLTKSGDIIVVLYGGAVPFVLRPHGEEYRFVGACYFHGVMDGEAMKTHKEIGAPDVEFRIR